MPLAIRQVMWPKKFFRSVASAQVIGANDAAVAGFTNIGLAGNCLASCDSDAGGDGGGCPGGSLCRTQTAAGPDCVPQ